MIYEQGVMPKKNYVLFRKEKLNHGHSSFMNKYYISFDLAEELLEKILTVQ